MEHGIWYWIVTILVGVVVPLLVYWLGEQQRTLRDKKKEIESLRKLISKLENDLIFTKNQIDAIHKQLDHRSEFAKLKYQVLVDQIADLNNWLKINTSFMPKSNNISKDFPTMTNHEDDNPPTGIY